MSDLETWRIQAWGLEPASCYEATCSKCGWKYLPGERSQEQSITELKRLGWRLRSNGAWCPECVLEHELSMDDSVVYPK